MASTNYKDEINELAKHLPPSIGFFVFWGRRILRIIDTDATRTFAFSLGLATIAYALYRLVIGIRSLIKTGKLNMYCHSQTGSWALVTGASDGIGKAFAEELLDRGFNVLLHGRNQQKLEALQQDFHTKFPKRTIDYVVADASSADCPEQSVVEKVKQLPGKLTVLVNNVGGIHHDPLYRPLGQLTAQELDASINCNIRFPTVLTSALLPTLKESQPSLILNCGSFGGVLPCPYIITYTATKAYIHNFTQGLRTELMAEGLQPASSKSELKGIEVMGFVIGNVRSRTNKEEMAYFTIDARDCAKGALNKVGSGRPLEFVSWRHALLLSVMSCMPQRILDSTTVDVMKRRKEIEEAKGKTE